MDHNLSIRYLHVPYNGTDVIANGFRQAGCVDRNDLRVINGKHVLDRLLQVGPAAKHRRPFRKRAGGRHDRIPEMPGQVHPVVGAAALRPVAVRKASVDAQRRVHGANGLAGFCRIDHQGLPFAYFIWCMIQHNVSPPQYPLNYQQARLQLMASFSTEEQCTPMWA